MGNAAGFLGTGACSAKISGHKFKERAIDKGVDFLQGHLASGAKKGAEKMDN